MENINHSAFPMIDEIPALFKGKDVWIAGSDPTLDGYPDDFFNDKTTITLHLAHLKFPNATARYTSEYDRSKHLLEIRDDYKAGLIISSLPLYGKTKSETKELLRNCSSVVYHNKIDYLPTGVRGEVSQRYTNWKVSRTIARKSRVWGGHGSCLHTCVYAALYLGAKSIHVIGSGHSLSSAGNADHFSIADEIHQNMRVGDTFTNPKIAFPVIKQTLALKKACELQGIPFYWHDHYTPNMDIHISVSDSLLEEMRLKAKPSYPMIKHLYRILYKRPMTLLLHSWR